MRVRRPRAKLPVISWSIAGQWTVHPVTIRSWSTRSRIEWTPRKLRHWFVSLMSASGAAVEEIAHIVGNSDTSTTGRSHRHELRPVIPAGRRS
jgi:integrase